MRDILFVTVFWLFCSGAYAEEVTHNLRVHLDFENSFLQVNDNLELNQELCLERVVRFRLHSGLGPIVLTPGVHLEKVGEASGSVPVEVFQVKLPKGICTIDLQYMGVIDHPPKSESSPGTISPDGVFLGGSTYWYPVIEGPLLKFRAEVSIASPWSVVSQGELISKHENKGKNIFFWRELKPQDDIYLVAAHFHYFSKQGANYKAEAWLRSPDGDLAEKYLGATLNYLELYDEMIGPYPYSKFSLVENFWATGYGMPSFTLLGSSIIRLPFILYTSYPHEILHNWWGNGVYVDYRFGNWSEGLTSYLADHYFKALRGQGHEYRRDALNNFSSYVNEDNDFPLSQFLGRYDKASSAIGYGKVMMLFHMLKVQLGEETFFQGIRQFFAENLFQKSSYESLRAAFETVSGAPLKDIFEQWVNRKGAPKVKLNSVVVQPDAQGWKVNLELEQIQKGELYRLFIPYEVRLESGQVLNVRVEMTQKVQHWSIPVAEKPKSLTVDPGFDVFRHLYPEEVPSTLSETFGETAELTLVLPSQSSELARYRQFSEILQARIPTKLVIVEDKDIELLPEKGRVWVLGWNSKFAPEVSCLFAGEGAQFSADTISLENQMYSKGEHSLVFSFRGGANGSASSCLGNSSDQAVVWTGLNSATDAHVLAGKIFHYGSYSFIGFDNQATNTLKGQWRVKSSPLHKEL